MTTKSTFKVLFVAHKGKLKRNGRAPILARMTVNGVMTHLTTNFDVDPERWVGKESRTLGVTREDKLINSMLDDYRALIINRYNRTLMIEDWELGQLYWNCLKAASGDEAIALSKSQREIF